MSSHSATLPWEGSANAERPSTTTGAVVVGFVSSVFGHASSNLNQRDSITLLNKSVTAVGSIPLNQQCGPADRCEDPNADCMVGSLGVTVCLCVETHFEKANSGFCSKSTSDLGLFCPHLHQDFWTTYEVLRSISAEKVPLNDPCDRNDVCRDDFAACDPFRDQCLCIEGYFERNRQCGRFNFWKFTWCRIHFAKKTETH